MKNAGASISLEGEFEGLIQAIYRNRRLTCFGKTSDGDQCGNSLSKETCKKLATLLEDIIELLENDGEGVETLLERASSLVMCVRRHQDQATTKFKEWSGRIQAKLAHDGGRVEKLSSTPTAKRSKNVTPRGSLSKEQKFESKNVVDIEQFGQYSSLKSGHSPLETDFDDSGFQSSSEEDLFDNQAIAPRKARTAASSSSAKYAAPQTPQKAAKPVSMDSGISMSFDSSDEAQKKRSVRYRDGPESPLAGKASRARRVIAGTPSSRPAPTPVQPPSLPIRTKRNFAPFHDPFIKMKSYVNKPLLGKEDLKEGYIYAFQLEGCAYTKIGYTDERDTQPSLEASLDKRIDEHKKSGRPDLMVVLKIPVLHAQRVEKLIHYHLHAGRIREQCTCRDANGRELKHGSHMEWFNNSLDEIHTVAKAWRRWMLSMPYSQLDEDSQDLNPELKIRHLSPEWKSRLENIQMQVDHDNWLDWLCRQVPELPILITKVSWDTGAYIEDESEAEVRGSFMRNSANGKNSLIKRVQTCLV